MQSVYCFATIWHKRVFHFDHAPKILQELDALLKQQKILLADLKAIGVVLGKGSFTAIRVAVTVANSLAYALTIPAIGLRELHLEDNLKILLSSSEQRYIHAEYAQEPWITLPHSE
jgi:tRNA A37 threonylcarbamoyltransferase TsaD